jgi:hypothetical protein
MSAIADAQGIELILSVLFSTERENNQNRSKATLRKLLWQKHRLKKKCGSKAIKVWKSETVAGREDSPRTTQSSKESDQQSNLLKHTTAGHHSDVVLILQLQSSKSEIIKY